VDSALSKLQQIGEGAVHNVAYKISKVLKYEILFQISVRIIIFQIILRISAILPVIKIIISSEIMFSIKHVNIKMMTYRFQVTFILKTRCPSNRAVSKLKLFKII